MKNKQNCSLSIQSQINNRKLSLDCEIRNSMKSLGFKSMLNQANIKKSKGVFTIHLIYLILLIPFLKKSLSFYWSKNCYINQTNARKDTFYRLLNKETFNWRNLVHMLASKIIDRCGDVPHRQKTLIADDTIAPKTGKNMEMVSYHFDHAKRRNILGYQFLQLGFHNGINFFPISVSPHTSTKRPNNRLRNIDKRTIGWRNRKESLRKKTETLIEMVAKAWNNGYDASFVMFDSWFAHDSIISKILDIGYGVICRLKRGKAKYKYNGEFYTLKQLWSKFAKKQTVWLPDLGLKAVCLNVCLKNSGIVRILFVSNGKKQWSAFLSTDLELNSSEILNYYSRRWSIEVFFKDAKQMLLLGKEQSSTFEAVVASYHLVMIRYLLLVNILNRLTFTGPIGPLFREIAENQIMQSVSEQLWSGIKELIIKSSDVILQNINPKSLLLLIDIIEEAVSGQHEILPAKL